MVSECKSDQSVKNMNPHTSEETTRLRENGISTTESHPLADDTESLRGDYPLHPVRNTEGDAVRPVPDGGRGWFCVLGGFIISMMGGAAVQCFSLFFIEFQNRFQSSTAATAWIYSVHMFTCMLVGMYK